MKGRFGRRRSGDGGLLASGGQEYSAAHLNPLRLWDVRTGTELRRFDGSNGTITVAFSPDGATLASGHRGLATLEHVQWQIAP